MADDTTPTRRPSFEFWLVVVMLGVMTFLVITVLLVKQSWLGTSDKMDILTWRKDVLAIIITAFGAWVGAGAAYFFGRENLRVAANSLLAMRDLSGKELLRRTSIKQIPPTSIDWTVKRTDLVTNVKTALMDKPERWFIPVVKDDGTLDTVINQEAVWRYLLNPTPPPATATVADLILYIEASPTLKRYIDIQAVVSMETNVGTANDLMDSRHVFLAIVTSEGKPTHFFTTSEVRKLLLKGTTPQSD
jgi:hypothetical protein